MAAPKTDQFDARTVSLARLAKALSHPARLAILETLAEKSTCICGEIVEVLPLAQSTVSQHLKELKDAGLVTGEIEGLTSCYCLDPSTIKELERLFGSFLKKLSKASAQERCC